MITTSAFANAAAKRRKIREVAVEAPRQRFGAREVGCRTRSIELRPGVLELLGDELAHLAAPESRARAGDRDRHGSRGQARSPPPRSRPAARRCAVSLRTRLAARIGRLKRRLELVADDAGPRASRWAAFIWPSTCGSPTTALSSEAATAKMWRNAAAPARQ